MPDVEDRKAYSCPCCHKKYTEKYNLRVCLSLTSDDILTAKIYIFAIAICKLYILFHI